MNADGNSDESIVPPNPTNNDATEGIRGVGRG